MFYRSKGFTLLEMLIAISLLAVVSIMSWRALDSLTRSRAQLGERAAQHQGMRQLFSQFDSDCATLVPYALLHQAPVSLRDDGLLLVRQVVAPLASPNEGNTSPNTVTPASAVNQWQVVLYRWVRTDAASGLGRVERLASAPSTQRAVLEAALRNLPLQESDNATIQRHVLLDDVKSLQGAAFLEGAGWMNQAAALAEQFPAWRVQNTGGLVRGLSLSVQHRSGTLQKSCLVAQ